MAKKITERKKLTYLDGDNFKKFLNKFSELEKEYDSFEVNAFTGLGGLDTIEVEFFITREETETEKKERIKEEKESLIRKIKFHKNLVEKFQNQFNEL